MATDIACKLCGGESALAWTGHPGYRQGMRFDIRHCAWCRTAFASPMTVDESLYDLIYANIATIPGYSRYERYMHEVARRRSPIRYLAAVEESYWAVLQAIEHNRRDNPAILEVGSGLGYFTHALREAGYAATGIDLSAAAVKVALERFGPWYRHATLSELRDEAPRYDFIVLSQVIEHVADPLALIRAAEPLLAPEGVLIIATPNRSSFDADVVWETELPPVHLWWFSEESLRWMGQRLNLEVSFVDFTEFHAKAPRFSRPAKKGRPSREAVLRADGSIAGPVGSRWRRRLKRMAGVLVGLEPSTQRLLARTLGRRRLAGPRGTDICALLRRHDGARNMRKDTP